MLGTVEVPGIVVAIVAVGFLLSGWLATGKTVVRRRQRDRESRLQE